MAVEFFASSRRSATLTQASHRHVFATCSRVGCAAGAAAASRADSFAGAFARCFPHLHGSDDHPPVPLMALASRLCSASRRRIAGLNASLFCSSRDACWRCAGVDAFSSDFALVSLPALLLLHAGDQGSDETLPLYLHLPEPHPECRLLMPVLPVPLCQFRFLPALHHVRLRRRVLCGVATVASATDSGRSGTRNIYATHLCILYLFDVQRVINQILLLFLVNGHIPYRRRGGGWAPA